MRRVIWILAFVAACSTASPDGGAFMLQESSINGPDSLPGTTETLQINNAGEYNHTLVVTDAGGNVLAATDVIPPGTDAVLSVDLSPGVYQVSCRLVSQGPDGSIIDHYELGMFKNLKVEG